jgi:hypothetical protein
MTLRAFPVSCARAELFATFLCAAFVLTACDSGPTAPTEAMATAAPTPAPAPMAVVSTPPTPPPAVEPPAATVRYVVVFDAWWSARTHPTDFPSNPHFSPMVGATHNDTIRFWSLGARASDGIKRMAEQGLTNPLDVDIRAAIGARSAQHLLLGGGIGVSPGQVSLEFDATVDHPLVTLVSMIAPSPDWFVGVSALPLLQNGQWVDEVRVELLPHDAGTDNGTTYSSPDQEASPRDAIARIEGRPFAVAGAVAPVGMFTFKRIR